MDILVTGASGFLGRAVTRRLAKEHRVTGLGYRHGGEGLVCLDLRDGDALDALVRQCAPDVVVHAAAYREPDYCEDHPDEAALLNVEPARLLARVLPPAATLIFISTDYVFDGLHPPYREHDTRRPVSVYGATKAQAEDAVLARPRSLVVRIPVLVGAGPSLAESGYVGQLIHSVRDKTPVLQDHVLVRMPTWIEDVAEALAFLIARRATGVVHMSGPQPATRYESALEVARVLGESHEHLSPSHAVVVRRAARPPNSRLATDKIRAMGFTPFTAFADVVRAVLAEFEGPR